MSSARVLVGLVLLLAAPAFATTWVDVEVTCPVCGTVNLFQAPGSFGSYVYDEPSRFQYVFWPATTDRFLYTCKRCHLTAYMGDFEEIPGEKVPALAAMLKKSGGITGELTPYYEIPMTLRLPIAEKVYELLDRDGDFWCEFRRIEGFHLEAAGNMDAAREARSKALAIAVKKLERPSPTRKETLVIAGAMRYFTGDVEGAKSDLGEAAGLTFRSPELSEESSVGLDSYLTELIELFQRDFLSRTRL
jgi:hypothetical protein